jgi:hypothetical protein
MEAPTLGPPQFAFKTSHPVSDDVRILERIEIDAEPGLQFEVAGARAKLSFDPKKTRAAIERERLVALGVGYNRTTRAVCLMLKRRVHRLYDQRPIAGNFSEGRLPIHYACDN